MRAPAVGWRRTPRRRLVTSGVLGGAAQAMTRRSRRRPGSDDELTNDCGRRVAAPRRDGGNRLASGRLANPRDVVNRLLTYPVADGVPAGWQTKARPERHTGACGQMRRSASWRAKPCRTMEEMRASLQSSTQCHPGFRRLRCRCSPRRAFRPSRRVLGNDRRRS